MLEMLSYEFIQRALIASVIIGLVCSIIGVFVILRNLTFIGAGTSHAAFAGVTLGYLLNYNPIYFAVVFSLLTVWIVGYLNRMGYLKLDASVGIFYSLTMALAVLFIGLMKVYNAEVYGYLFGSILSVTSMDMKIILILGRIVLLSPAEYDRPDHCHLPEIGRGHPGLRIDCDPGGGRLSIDLQHDPDVPLLRPA